MSISEQKNDLLKNYSWQFKEYEQYERSIWWYLLTIAIGGALVIYSILTANFLFAVIVIMAGILLVIQHRHIPENINLTINHRGITLNNKNYPYKEIEKFWIIYEPPTTKRIYFIFKNFIRPRLSIPLFDQNPLEIKNFLKLYLQNDPYENNEPLSESLRRLIKF